MDDINLTSDSNYVSSGDSSETAGLAGQLRDLLYSDERYRIAAENSSEIIIDYNLLQDSVYFATSRVKQLYGIPQNIEGGRDYLVRNGIVQPESEYDFLEMFQRIRDGVPRAQCTVKTRTAEGEFRWNQIVLSTLFDENNRSVRAIGVMKDITQQKEVELQYESELLYRDAMRRDALLVYEMDLTHRRAISGAELPLSQLGVPYTDDYDEVTRLIIGKMVHHEDQQMLLSVLDADSLLYEYSRGNSKIEVEYRRVTETGDPFWVCCTVYLTDDKQEETVRAFYYVHDINEAKKEELRLREKAERDLLTGLYNKVTTEQLVSLATASAPPEGTVCAFYIIDLDNFKGINDQLGHAFGDAVLSETARKLQALCSSGDIAGRIGGDEFALFVKNLSSREAAAACAENICALFHNVYSGAVQNLKVSGTVGVSIFPDDASSFGDLYHKADLALYAAKNKGKDTYCVYTPDLHEAGDGSRVATVIDRGAGKSFSDNVIEYVFRILYESQDLRRAVSGILELITKHFNFSRGYIYEAMGTSSLYQCTFEWCAPGIASLKGELPRLEGNLAELCTSMFQEDRMCVMETPADIPLLFRVTPALRNVCSRLQYALHSEGQLSGFIGFDQCGDTALNPAKLSVLEGVAQTLDLFFSERKANEKRQHAQAMLQAITDGMHTCTYVVDPATYVLNFVNESTLEKIPNAKAGTFCYAGIRGRSKPCDDCPLGQMLNKGLREYQTEMYLDPYHLWAKIDVSLIQLADGKEYALFAGHDFTEQRGENDPQVVNADAFTRDATLYNALSRSTDDYLYMCDMSRNLFYFPQEMVDEFWLPAQIVEDAIPLWRSRLHVNDRESFTRDIANMMEGKTNCHYQEYRALNKDGQWVWLRCRGYLHRNKSGVPTLFAGVITNLEKKSIIDSLTGLPNKYQFERRLRETLTQRVGGWLMLLGLDNFKNVNNLYGWEFGDHILHDAARKLQALLPEYLQFYRLDGDKFGVYCVNGSGPSVESIYNAVYNAFQPQQECDGRRYYCTVSGGYTMFEEDTVSFTTLFRQAEFALDYSKSEGKNRLNRYSEPLMGNKDRILTLIERLRESVDHGCAGFELFYQPQVDAASQKLHGAEALLRWSCRDYGSVSPVEFIPLLEQTGLIHAVGRWVIEQAAATSRNWCRTHPNFTISVNISFLQLQDNGFLPYLEQLIRAGKLEPSHIHLELTESCIATTSASLLELFYNLRRIGFCIEMDDFGTGYSSLSVLKTAPADIVKIDRAFVMNIADSDFDATFIQFIVSLCHSVGIRVCLEGVETWEEYRLVEPMKLDYIQGYLFGKPQSRASFEQNFLKNK